MPIMKEIETEHELENVLELCYRVLGEDTSGLYSREAWRKRLLDGGQPLVYAEEDGRAVSAVLGRRESEDSLVIGFVACDPDYRGQGVTKSLMKFFEEIARDMGFKYITLGSKADGFYEKCGYNVIFQVHDQNIYQKFL